MDYRYLLFFEKSAELDVLEHLATMAEPYESTTDLVLPDRVIRLPYAPWRDTPPRITPQDTCDRWDFMTVLCFESDDAIDFYNRHHPRYDDQGRATIGVVYLSVYRDLTDQPWGTGEDLVLFAFETPGSSMSVLFTESDSIRESFTHLLVACDGVCGVLDREDAADLFWLRGAEVDVRLPTAELTLAQIEELADDSATPGTSFTADEVCATARHLRRVIGGTELGVHHWLLALLDSGVPLAGHLADADPGIAAAELRRRLNAGVIGDPLPEDVVKRRAGALARRRGDELVTSAALAEVVAQAASSVSL